MKLKENEIVPNSEVFIIENSNPVQKKKLRNFSKIKKL